jgi:hypothetical protein
MDLPNSDFSIPVQPKSGKSMVENIQTLSFQRAFFARKNPYYLDYPTRVSGISHPPDLNNE